MAKKKIDLKQLAQFFYQKGERLGLGIAAVIMALLIVLGVMAGSSSKNWAKAVQEEAKKSKDLILAAHPPTDGQAQEKVPVDWALLNAKDIPYQVSWFDLQENNDNKRRNPYALPIIAREIQIDYMQGALYGYEIDTTKAQFAAFVAGANAKQATPAKTIRPKRAVVVHAAFPYKEQLELFQKFLRFPGLPELMASKDDMPKFMGLVVTRTEVMADGQTGEQVQLFKYEEAKDRTVVAGHLDPVFREAIYQTVPAELRKFIRSGLVTPFPEMAIGTYPALDLPTIKAAAIPPFTKVGGGGGGIRPVQPLLPGLQLPMQPEAEPQGQFQWLPYDSAPKPLPDKFAGKYFAFEPWEGADAPKGGVDTGFPPIGRQPEGGQGQVPDLSEIVPEKILVRFFDVDVQPESTYRYTIEVRLANPNFGKSKDVAFAQLAEAKEFRSPAVVTPTISVPRDFDYYVYDQTPTAAGNDIYKMTASFAPVQIQRWIDKSEGGNYVGDWAVAERLLVRRGETIGRSSVITEVPEWIASKERFEIGTTTRSGKGKIPGIPIDFRIGNPSPILVDFDGGKRTDYRDEQFPNVRVDKEEAEIATLVLTPEGKLILRSSAIDGNEKTREGKERLDHYNQWRDRLRQLRGGGEAGDKKGNNPFPGGG